MNPSTTRRRGRGGFTIIELLIAMVVGVVVFMSATGILLATFRAQAGSDMREEVARNARFLGEALQRDLSEAGVELRSTSTFGSVDVRNDTISVLSVPFDPDEAPVYRIAPPAGSPNPLPAGGTCGSACIAVVSDSAGKPVRLQVGDVAKLQVNNVRHLIVVTDVAAAGPDTFRISFLNTDSLLHRPAAFAGGLLLDRAGTSIQRLTMAAYWRDASGRLMRATRFNPNGTLQGESLFEDVTAFQVSVIFLDGDELTSVSGTDADQTNNYDQIASVRVQGTLESSTTNPHVNSGSPAQRRFSWRFSPRNLRYERARPS
jgi:prepilin-type N-terminal cleavage/methylation domain-containing protein